VELRGERVVLRPLRVEDAPRLAELAADKEVSRWWGELHESELVEQAQGQGDSIGFAVLHEGELAGLIQFSEELDPMYRQAGIDLFLGTAYQNLGLGADAVRTLSRHLFRERGHHRITIDPAADNVRAIRAYEKVGFRPVGVMREYERGPDGAWRDGLLLDLLARELDR
jgi:aminoglycoside 6'-N-acetyltransferase